MIGIGKAVNIEKINLQGIGANIGAKLKQKYVYDLSWFLSMPITICIIEILQQNDV